MRKIALYSVCEENYDELILQNNMHEIVHLLQSMTKKVNQN